MEKLRKNKIKISINSRQQQLTNSKPLPQKRGAQEERASKGTNEKADERASDMSFWRTAGCCLKARSKKKCCRLYTQELKVVALRLRWSSTGWAGRCACPRRALLKLKACLMRKLNWHVNVCVCVCLKEKQRKKCYPGWH